MERITKWENENAVLSDYDYEEMKDKFYKDNDVVDCVNLEFALEKLAEYEDAEEQGLLLRLPCKVDDMVWITDFGKLCAYRITGYSFGVAEDYINEPISETELVFYYENLSMAGSFAMSAIGKSVFLTKEEAEQALKRMGA